MSNPKPDHHSRNTSPGKASGIKPTAKEVTKRIRQAADLICSGYRRTQIVDVMCTEYGVAWQTVQEYCRRARELLLEESGKPKEEHRAEVLGEYQVVLRDKEAAHSDKLQALKGKREMLGLDAPKRAEISTPEGGKVALEVKTQKDVDYDALGQVARDLFGVSATDSNGEPIYRASPDTETGAVPGHNGD